MKDCIDCQDKDVEIANLQQQIDKLQSQVQALRGALENAYSDPDVQIAVLDALRNQVVDQLRQKYLRLGGMSSG